METQTTERKKSMFRLLGVIGSNTIRITPVWEWNGNSGTIVNINGYAFPESLSQPIKVIHGYILQQRLQTLIQGFEIKLLNPVSVYRIGDENCIKCDVFLNGVNIANYFPEYKTK